MCVLPSRLPLAVISISQVSACGVWVIGVLLGLCAGGRGLVGHLPSCKVCKMMTTQTSTPYLTVTVTAHTLSRGTLLRYYLKGLLAAIHLTSA